MKPIFPQLRSEHLLERASYFISDLHLSDNTPHINHRFEAFLQTVAPHADAIYILGDFLDAWIGDDTPAQFLPSLIKACQQAAQHTPLYFLPGNRDFLVSNNLLKQCQMTRLTDPCTIDLYSETVALCHGDHLCGEDKKHLLFRRICRTRWIQKLFLRLPLHVRLQVAQELQRGEQPATVTYDATENKVLKAFGKTHTLIHGHTHLPNHHIHNKGDRFVLGCWGEGGVVLRCDPTGSKQLLNWVS